MLSANSFPLIALCLVITGGVMGLYKRMSGHVGERGGAAPPPSCQTKQRHRDD